MYFSGAIERKCCMSDQYSTGGWQVGLYGCKFLYLCEAGQYHCNSTVKIKTVCHDCYRAMRGGECTDI